MTDDAVAGWTLFAAEDDAADIVRALLELEPGTEYAQSEIADEANIPLKTLYLSGTLGTLVDLGLLARHEGDSQSETTYVVDAESDVYQAAAAFGEALSAASDAAEA